MHFKLEAFQKISMWKSNNRFDAEISTDTDRPVKLQTKINWHKSKFASSANVAAFTKSVDDELVCLAPAGTLQTPRVATLALSLQGNPLLAPQLHLNGIWLWVYPFLDFQPHILPLFLCPCQSGWELSTLPVRLEPISTASHPATSLHDPGSTVG